jgi:hypothetical protein
MKGCKEIKIGKSLIRRFWHAFQNARKPCKYFVFRGFGERLKKIPLEAKKVLFLLSAP